MIRVPEPVSEAELTAASGNELARTLDETIEATTRASPSRTREQLRIDHGRPRVPVEQIDLFNGGYPAQFVSVRAELRERQYAPESVQVEEIAFPQFVARFRPRESTVRCRNSWRDPGHVSNRA